MTRYELKIRKTLVQGDEASIISRALQVAFRNNHPKRIKIKVSRNQIIRVEEDRKINFEKLIPAALDVLRSLDEQLTRKQKINAVASFINQFRKKQ